MIKDAKNIKVEKRYYFNKPNGYIGIDNVSLLSYETEETGNNKFYMVMVDWDEKITSYPYKTTLNVEGFNETFYIDRYSEEQGNREYAHWICSTKKEINDWKSKFEKYVRPTYENPILDKLYLALEEHGQKEGYEPWTVKENNTIEEYTEEEKHFIEVRTDIFDYNSSVWDELDNILKENNIDSFFDCYSCGVHRAYIWEEI